MFIYIELLRNTAIAPLHFKFSAAFVPGVERIKKSVISFSNLRNQILKWMKRLRLFLIKNIRSEP